MGFLVARASLLAIPLAFAVWTALAVPGAAAASYGNPGVCAAVSAKGSITPSLGTGSYRVSDDDRVTAYVGGFTGGLLTNEPKPRVLRRDGRLRGIALCKGKRTVARLPLPRDRRADVVAVSVNGRRVAWRTTVNGRGTLSVGTAHGRIVRAARSSTTRALFGTGPKQRVTGQLLVTPDGSVAWSLPVGKRAGVWLWPHGQRPRRIAVTARDKVTGYAGRDVRIVDRHHVLIGPDGEIARYEPPTPDRCPVGIGVTAKTIGPLQARFSSGAFTEQYGEGAGWSHLLICDPVVGDYTRVLSFGSYSSGIGSSGDYSSSHRPTRVAFTAGTLVVEQATSSYGGGGTDIEYRALIVPRDPAEPIRSASDGGIAGSDIEPPAPMPTNPTARIAVRMVPGAVAWTERDPTTRVISVWLADADGRRAIGTATPRDIVTPGGRTPTSDTELDLGPDVVTWNTPTGTARAPVVPVFGAALEVARFSH